MTGTLICDHCGKEFTPKRARWQGVAYCTPVCKRAAYVADGRAAAIALKSYYKTRYDLTSEQADEMREKGCVICGTTDWGSRWGNGHIDHDHTTGQVRGVLCTNCNIGLGKFKDDPDLLRRAADYIDLVP